MSRPNMVYFLSLGSSQQTRGNILSTGRPSSRLTLTQSLCVSVLFKVGPAVLTAFRIHLHPGTGRSEAVCDAHLSVVSSSLAAS